MHLTQGEVIKSSMEDIRKCKCGWPNWPHAFINMKGDPWKFLQTSRSQYTQFCYGNLIEELKEICRLYDIEYVIS